jgi:hypothetical protein
MDCGLDTRISVEWIILADAAEVVNGKLYLLGGGWDTLVVTTGFPVTRQCGLAVGFRVPWAATNQRQRAVVEITDEDATAKVATLQTQFEVGRPAGIPHGQSQRFQMAATVPLTFQRDGIYTITVLLDGEPVRYTTFRVARSGRAEA